MTVEIGETASAIDPHPLRDRAMIGNVLLTFTANAIYSLSSWAILIYLTRVESAEVVGRFAWPFALTAPIMMFADMRLRTVLVTDAKGEFTSAELMLLRVGAGMSGVIAAVAIAAVVKPAVTLLVLWIALARLFDLASDLFHGMQQQRERFARVTISRCLQGVLQFVAFASVHARWGRLEFSLLAYATASAAVTLIYDYSATRRIVEDPGLRLSRIRRKPFTRLIAVALPLGFAQLFAALYSSIPRYVVDATLGAAALGVFSAIFWMQTAGNLVVSALAYAVMPRLSKYYASGRIAEFRRLTRVLVLSGFLLGVVATALSALFGRPILMLVYGERYATSAGLLIGLMAATTPWFASVFFGTAVAAARQFSVQLPSNIVICIVVTVAALPLVRLLGIAGANAAIAAGHMTLAFIYYSHYRRLFR